ncbi:hypothetical protein SO802_027723 [Lithocarpus litseifolius]|uniref:Uncharacterized protein n=1 Tax=Lithocarpus litseifolius TaxID=425828 RepID=A0AAW2C461_9ROSI
MTHVVLSGGGLGYSVGYDAAEKKVMDGNDDEAAVVVSRPIERKDSMELSFLKNENEKPPVSARFAHRKALPHDLLPKQNMSSLSPISSTLIKRTWIPFYSFFNSTTAKAPPLLLISQYSPIIISLRNQNPTSLSALLLPNNDPFKSPPEFPKPPNHQPLPIVPLEVPQISTTPEIDPAGNTPPPPEVNTNPPPYGPDPVPVPGPEFPKPAIPRQRPELPKPPIPPRPDTLPDPGPELPIPDPDIPLPKPDVVPPDYVPQRPPWPEIVPPPFPDISPPTGPYVL